jgi:hypothetical protein
MTNPEESMPGHDEPDSSDNPVKWEEWARNRIVSLMTRVGIAESKAQEAREHNEKMEATLRAAEKWIKARTEDSIYTFRPGEKVKILVPGIITIVDKVVITRTGIQYEVFWWDCKTRRSCTVSHDEVGDGDYLPVTPEE